MLTYLAALALTEPGLRPPPPTNWPTCSLLHRAQVFARLEDLPQLIQDRLRADVGEIAEAGQPFESTDAGHNGPDRRFLRGLHSGRLWIVWYEHGGRGLHRHVLAYGVGISGFHGRPSALLEANFVGFDPCRETDAILDGVRSASPGDL